MNHYDRNRKDGYDNYRQYLYVHNGFDTPVIAIEQTVQAKRLADNKAQLVALQAKAVLEQGRIADALEKIVNTLGDDPSVPKLQSLIIEFVGGHPGTPEGSPEGKHARSPQPPRIVRAMRDRHPLNF